MSHKHTDEQCKHELAFCVRCDVPFCKKCEREWAEPCRQAHYYWTSSPSVAGGTTTIYSTQSTDVPMNVVTINGADYPVLAKAWNNHEDCAYDRVGV